MSANANLLGFFRLQVWSILTKMVCFNLTGCPVESLERRFPVICAMWNESVNRRWAGDVASAWIRILQEYHNHDSITIWADNCSGQNKNYYLFKTLNQLVNSDEVLFKNITLKYLKSGVFNPHRATYKQSTISIPVKLLIFNCCNMSHPLQAI